MNSTTVMIRRGAPPQSIRELIKACAEDPVSIELIGDVKELAKRISPVELLEYDTLLQENLILGVKLREAEKQIVQLEAEMSDLQMSIGAQPWS